MKKRFFILLALVVISLNICFVLAEEPEQNEEMLLNFFNENLITSNLLAVYINKEKAEEQQIEIKLINEDAYLYSEYPVADDIKNKQEKTTKHYSIIPGSFYQLSDHFEELCKYADRKGGIQLIDYLICIQASDEQIREAYGIGYGYTVEQLLELVHKYQNFTGLKPEDILYEEFNGDIYYRSFPYTLIHYIGIDAFDEWKQAAKGKDCLYGDTLPNCLNYFEVSNEKFSELVREGGFDYFYTPERQENIFQMRLDNTKMPGFITTYARINRYQPILPEDVVKSRDENLYYFSINGLYIHLDREYYYQWREIANRKNPYFGKYLVDYLVNIQASDETIAEIYDQDTRISLYEIPEYSLEELLALVHKYENFDKVPKEDILYEEAYGNLYYRTFPRTLTDYIGAEAFDKWRRQALKQDAAYGDTLPKCLDYFSISNEKFTELVKEGSFDYFFTPERLESITQMRETAN